MALETIHRQQFADPERDRVQKPRVVSEEEWLKAISDGTKRMSQDEAFRLEIARQLS